ncbi:cytochrome c maturation protein CcmE [Bartonella sp. B30(2025)]
MNSQSLGNSSSLKAVLKQRKKSRVLMILLCIFVIFIAISLIVYAMRHTVNYFRMPSEITKEDILMGRSLRLGGFVEKGTVQYLDKTKITFFITDNKKHEKVIFNGILPDLFREGQGVIVEGYFDKRGLFIGTRVLAKHDETYMPKTAVNCLKKRYDVERQLSCAR